MTLSYASPAVPNARRRDRGSRWAGVLLALLAAVPMTLCVHAVRWDRWARYENRNRPWYDKFMIESYSSFKAWRAWRASWERASTAAAISGAALALAAGWGGITLLRRRAASRWLIVAIVLHAMVMAYFIARWGPDFKHPFYTWDG